MHICVPVCSLSLSICMNIIPLVKFFHAEFHSPYLCMHLYVVKTIHRHTYVHTLFLFLFKISPLEAWILKSFASGTSVFGTKTFTCPISTCQSWGWCNNEMSSCPLVNWNEENVMFWWENQDRVRDNGRTICFCAFLHMTEPWGAGKRWDLFMLQ